MSMIWTCLLGKLREENRTTEHQTQDLGDRTQTRAVCDHELQVETEVPEWLQLFTENGTINEGS